MTYYVIKISNIFVFERIIWYTLMISVNINEKSLHLAPIYLLTSGIKDLFSSCYFADQFYL